MAYFQYRQALVNRSGTTIPVYEKTVRSSYHAASITAGGAQIGEIKPNDFYVLLPNDVSSVTCYRVIFRNYNGKQAAGYIETCPAYTYDDYAWAKYQEPFQYYNSNGSTLVKAAQSTIDGKTYYTFTITGASLNYLNPDGKSQGYLPAGTRLATTSSTVGQTYEGYMVFYKKKFPQRAWQNLITGGTYGFVNLGLANGASPSNRPIR